MRPIVLEESAFKGAPSSGIYVLIIQVARQTGVAVGRWGKATFPAGFYAYVGRSSRGLAGRIARHARREGKRMHWHVDYLLEEAEPLEAWILPLESGECRTADLLERRGGRRSGLEGFGASDCRCAGHLLYMGTLRPAPEDWLPAHLVKTLYVAPDRVTRVKAERASRE